MNYETGRSQNRSAFEGLGGSGKTHVMQILTTRLESSGRSVLRGKISGMGSGSKVDLLREINSYREGMLASDQATPKMIEDKRRDKVFRIATRYQVRELVKQLDNGHTYDHVFLDRTPLMPWVYSGSVDPKNPYLDEMLIDGLEISKRLGLSSVYLFDLSPETALARMMARICGSQTSTQEIAERCGKLKVPTGVIDVVVQKVSLLLANTPNLQPKKFEKYPFVPFDVLIRERDRFAEASCRLSNTLGVRSVTINAEMGIDYVVGSIEKDVLDHS